jgi:putative ABC transport system permease protein
MTLAMVAIAFAIRFHLRSKRVGAAVLRATGASRRLIALCFFGQTALLGLFAASFGVVGGIAVHAILTTLARNNLNLDITEHLDPTIAIATVGFMLLSLVWAAAPSISYTSRTPALAVLRSDFEVPSKQKALYWLDFAVRLLSGVLIMMIAWILSGADKSAAILLAGAAATLIVSVALAAGARWVAKRVGGRVENFPLRFAVRNLYRPGNQTLAVVSSIALALALSCAVSVLEATLDALRGVGTDYGEANVFLYELSPEQAPQAAQILEKHGGRAIQQLPVVLMRLQSIKGTPVSEILRKDQPDAPPRWTLTREYWTSYRDHLLSNERIVAGQWFGTTETDRTAVPISLEDTLAETVEWDVQGVSVLTRVTSMRDILWERFERNSFVVFPPGVLEGAPQFLFWSLSLQDAAARGAFVKETSTLLPNVSVIDLTLVVREALAILSTVGIGLKILFGIIALTAMGLLLITALGARAERASEFRTLAQIGMRRPTKRTIVRTEFILLGTLATLCGIGLGLALGFSIAHFALHVPVVFDWWRIAALSLGCLAFCWGAGRIVSS